MSDLKVPKERVRVDLQLVGRRQISGWMFVAEAQPPESADKLRETLTQSVFVPFEALDGQSLLVRTDQLLWVTFLGVPSEPRLFEVDSAVVVEFPAGERLEGDLLFTPPKGQGRALDHLIGQGRFFWLWGQKARFLVNATQVAWVRLPDALHGGA